MTNTLTHTCIQYHNNTFSFIHRLSWGFVHSLTVFWGLEGAGEPRHTLSSLALEWNGMEHESSQLTMKFCWRGAHVNMGGMGLTALMVLMGTQSGSEAEEVTWVCLMTAWWGGASTEHTHTGPTPITVWSSCSSSSEWRKEQLINL